MSVIPLWKGPATTGGGDADMRESITLVGEALTIPATIDPTASAAAAYTYSYVDMAPYTQARVVRKLITGADPEREIAVMYYDSDAGSWQYLDGVSGPFVQVHTGGSSSNDPTSIVAGDWVNLSAGARADVPVMLVARSGLGTLGDTILGLVELQLR